MSTESKQRPYLKTVLYGAVSVALYVALLKQQELVNGTFAKGGLYAFLPIAMAFVFSFIHGNFTGSFWSSLGVEASKKHKEAR